MKAWTGGGDRGRTSLMSGERVAKTHIRVEAGGEVDELNCVTGALIASLPAEDQGLRGALLAVQEDLLCLGARVSAGPGSPASARLPAFGAENTHRIEAFIDRFEAGLPRLQGFVLPGGHPAAAWAHLARAVCRRAERRVIQCSAETGEPEHGGPLAESVAYLNRLSTLFFSIARLCNRIVGISETTWQA